MTTSNSLFSFRIGECEVGRIEINKKDLVMVSCIKPMFVRFRLKTKELTIDGGKTGFKTGNELDFIKFFDGPPSQI